MLSRYQKIGLLVALLLVIGIIVFIVISLLPQKVVVRFNTETGAIATLYKAASSEDLHDLEDDQIKGVKVQEITSAKEMSLVRGSYIISITGENVEKKRYALTVDGPVSQQIAVDYSEAYLTAQLKKIEPLIHADLKKQLPSIQGVYDIRTGKLHELANWYTTRLRYIGPDKYHRDTLLVIMKKENNTWKLVTKTPEIIVSYPKYPSVPREIIKSINADEPVNIIPVSE